MTVRNSRKLLSLGAFLLALILTMSMLTVSVFADETDGADAPEGELLMTTSNDETDGIESDEIPSNEIDGAEADDAVTTTAADDTAETTDTTDDTAKDPQQVKVLVISWIIVVAIIAVIVVICVTKRDKVVPFFKGLKSEAKKVVWTKKEDVVKSTLVTLVIIAATFVVVFVLDFAFSKGINALSNLFR